VTHLAVTHRQIQGQAPSPHRLHCNSPCSHTSADPRSSAKSKQTALRLTLQSYISRSKVKRQVQTVTHLAVTHRQIQGQAPSPSRLHCDSPCSHASADPRSSAKSKPTALRLTLQSHIGRSEVKRQVQADCTATHLAVTHRQIQGQAPSPNCDSPCSHTSADPRSSAKSKQTALRLTLQSHIGRSKVKRQVQADCTATHLAVTHQQIQGQAPSPSRLHCNSPCSHTSADPRSSAKSKQTALRLTLQSYGVCLITSGAIQNGVPTNVLFLFMVLVSWPATPKSASFTSPLSDSSTFAADTHSTDMSSINRHVHPSHHVCQAASQHSSAITTDNACHISAPIKRTTRSK